MANVIQSGSPAASKDAAGRSGVKSRRRRRGSRLVGLVFVSPWIIGLTLFYIGPMLATLVMSFTNYKFNGGTGTPTKFVGLDQWSRLLHDPAVSTGVVVTFKFALIFIPLSMVLPLSLAYLLTSKHLFGRSFFRAAFFLPAIVPGVSALAVWKGFLNGDDGWLNRMLGTIGIHGPDWINDKPWVLPSYGLIATWAVGNAILIFISALSGVPKDLFEAARLDGAGSLRIFRNVTLPMISPITFYNLILTLVALGQYFIVPFIMTDSTAGPDNAALFYTLNFYRETFRFYDAGYGSALAWAMFAFIMVLTGLLFWSQKFWVHYEYEVKK